MDGVLLARAGACGDRPVGGYDCDEGGLRGPIAPLSPHIMHGARIYINAKYYSRTDLILCTVDLWFRLLLSTHTALIGTKQA